MGNTEPNQHNSKKQCFLTSLETHATITTDNNIFAKNKPKNKDEGNIWNSNAVCNSNAKEKRNYSAVITQNLSPKRTATRKISTISLAEEFLKESYKNAKKPNVSPNKNNRRKRWQERNNRNKRHINNTSKNNERHVF